MQLQIDEQTLLDLSIFGGSGKASVYSQFNKTQTQGGSLMMEALFRRPMADAAAINEAAARYRFFHETDTHYPIASENISTASYYLENEDVRTQIQLGGQGFGQRFKDLVAADPDYLFVHDGVQAVLRVFFQTNRFIEQFQVKAIGSPYEGEYKQLRQLVNAPSFKDIVGLSTDKQQPRLSAMQLSDLDKLIRFKEREKVLELLQFLLQLDVYMTVGRVARDQGFRFAQALPSGSSVLMYEGVFHPHVPGAVGNDLSLDQRHNMLFLTGANMAGKSTLMKSLGICLYLAHMGFPVPAKAFQFSVKDGIYTSINLSDNLQAGASHYYAEVLRVKEVATQLAAKKQLFVIFDELFRGTNVKDAHDATLAITRAFVRHADSQFIISTHIIEAGEVLMQELLPITYQYLPTEMDGNVPTYTRVLRNGITADRHGMIILQNEQVLDILDQGLARISAEPCNN